MQLNTQGGYINLYRKMMQWQWYHDANTFRVFVHLIFSANYAESRYRGILLRRGQALTTLGKLSDDLHISLRSVRTALDHLKSTNEITIEPTTKFTVITVNKYNDYQTATNETTNRRQTSDKPTTNGHTNIYKKNKKENKERERALAAHGTFGNVMLTDEELSALRQRYPHSCDEKINRLSRWLENKPERSFRNHYAVLLDWLEEDVGSADQTARTSSYDIDALDKINTLEGY